MILADKIITLRKKNGWSQEELAEKVGVSRQAISKWESAQSVPDLDKILRIAEPYVRSVSKTGDLEKVGKGFWLSILKNLLNESCTEFGKTVGSDVGVYLLGSYAERLG